MVKYLKIYWYPKHTFEETPYILLLHTLCCRLNSLLLFVKYMCKKVISIDDSVVLVRTFSVGLVNSGLSVSLDNVFLKFFFYRVLPRILKDYGSTLP